MDSFYTEKFVISQSIKWKKKFIYSRISEEINTKMHLQKLKIVIKKYYLSLIKLSLSQILITICVTRWLQQISL